MAYFLTSRSTDRTVSRCPFLEINNSNDGGDWMAHGVHAGQIYARQGKTRFGSEKLYEVTDQIIRKHIAEGHIKKDE